LPSGPFVRSDSAFSEAGEVSQSYDPMIAKVSVWAPTRPEAVERMRVALDESRVVAPKDAQNLKKGSLRTNLSFLRRLARNKDVIEGNTTTDLIGKNSALTADPTQAPEISLSAALAVSIYQMIHETTVPSPERRKSSVWSHTARREGVRS
jgi:acetyl/propionyl-CoA carboxylase alpha subunit